MDGLEHKREKWNYIARKILLTDEKLYIKYADVTVTDNKAIQQYVFKTYSKHSKFIAYGGDHVKRNVTSAYTENILKKFGLQKQEYYIALCRIEPENNCHLILEAFANLDKTLLFIGNFDNGTYSQNLKKKYQNTSNIIISNPIYDLDTLFVLRSNAKGYIHGHSAGGTNPSLVEAMFFDVPVFAFDVIYNRETTDNSASYFKDILSLRDLISYKQTYSAEKTKRFAEENYTWQKIVTQYEALY